MKRFLFTALISGCFFTGQMQAQVSSPAASLTRIWECTDDLITPESVLYNPDENVLYVSCINEHPWEKDNNGYIARLSADGKVLNARWATGLNAPKGMGITGGKLYVTDIDRVAVIDLSSGRILKWYLNPLAENLNDIAVSSQGTVYVSDSKGPFLFRIKDGELTELSGAPGTGMSNGLYLEKGLLLFGQQNRIGALDPENRQSETYIANTGYIDGIEAVGKQQYLISDWAGHIFLAEPGKEKQLLLDTTKDGLNAADIGYNPNGRIVYVPTFFHNGVTAYRFNPGAAEN